MKTKTRKIVLWSNPSKRGTEKAYCFFVGSDSFFGNDLDTKITYFAYQP